MIERIVASRDALVHEFVARLEQQARSTIAARGSFSMAVSGGSIAHVFLPALVDADVQWASVDVLWCDERVVAHTDPESNCNVAWQLWLQRLAPDASPRVYRMPVDTVPIEVAAEEYERDVKHVLAASGGALDCVILGVGPDGHVASLFPGYPSLRAEASRLVSPVRGAPKPPPDRLTLTLPVLAQARTVMLAAFGVEKANVVREVLDRESSALPAALLLRQCRKALVMLDSDAASLLESRLE